MITAYIARCMFLRRRELRVRGSLEGLGPLFDIDLAPWLHLCGPQGPKKGPSGRNPKTTNADKNRRRRRSRSDGGREETFPGTGFSSRVVFWTAPGHIEGPRRPKTEQKSPVVIHDAKIWVRESTIDPWNDPRARSDQNFEADPAAATRRPLEAKKTRETSKNLDLVRKPRREDLRDLLRPSRPKLPVRREESARAAGARPSGPARGRSGGR